MRLNARVLDCPPFAGASNAALYFVGHQQNSMLVADSPQLLHEDSRRGNVPAFALNRLDKNRRDLLWREDGLEQLFFNVSRASDRILLAFAIDIGILDVGHAWDEWREPPFLLRL